MNTAVRMNQGPGMPGIRTTTPVKAPQKSPIRRLFPDELCPSQKERVVRTIRRDI